MSDCEKYLELISCAVDGELTDSEKAELDAHIAVCPDCAALLDMLTGASSALTDDVEPPKALLDGVMAGVHKINVQKRKRVFIKYTSLAACAAIVCFAGIRLLPRMGAKEADCAATETVFDTEIYANGADAKRTDEAIMRSTVSDSVEDTCEDCESEPTSAYPGSAECENGAVLPPEYMNYSFLPEDLIADGNDVLYLDAASIPEELAGNDDRLVLGFTDGRECCEITPEERDMLLEAYADLISSAPAEKSEKGTESSSIFLVYGRAE